MNNCTADHQRHANDIVDNIGLEARAGDDDDNERSELLDDGETMRADDHEIV